MNGTLKSSDSYLPKTGQLIDNSCRPSLATTVNSSLPRSTFKIFGPKAATDVAPSFLVDDTCEEVRSCSSCLDKDVDILLWNYSLSSSNNFPTIEIIQVIRLKKVSWKMKKLWCEDYWDNLCAAVCRLSAHAVMFCFLFLRKIYLNRNATFLNGLSSWLS